MAQPVTTEACDKEEKRFRLCCFTIYDMQYDFSKLNSKLQYYAYGKEVCPKTKKDHYQAFGYAKVAQRWSWWRKLLSPHHFEQCMGTLEENDKYCSKDGLYTEYGLKPMGNGKKRSLQELCTHIVDAAENNVPLYEIVTVPENQSTYVQYNNGIEKLYNHAVTKRLRSIPRDFAPEVVYIYGPPGLGKTRYVLDREPDVYMVPDDDFYKWKDGYHGQPAVLYDNVTPTNINPVKLLREIDRNYINVAQKGKMIGWRPERIYITSVFEMQMFANLAGFSLATEFTRRVTRVEEYTAERAAAEEYARQRVRELENEREIIAMNGE